MLACLIHSSILFAQYKQLLKRFHPLRLQPPRIHQLPLLLHPIQHIMLLNPVLRRIPMIHLNEALHLIISFQPTRLLIHTSYIRPQPSFSILLSHPKRIFHRCQSISTNSIGITSHRNKLKLAKGHILHTCFCFGCHHGIIHLIFFHI